MNLLNKLTIKNLKLNKKRTIVTIIGIMLSVALITAVATMYSSAIESLIRFETKQRGYFHVAFYDVNCDDLYKIENNQGVENIYLTTNVGYAKLDNSKNKDKQYAYIKAFTKGALDNLSIKLIDGRLPENNNEIIIPSHLKTNARIEYHVGDTITLDVGKRVSNGVELTQQNPYNEENNEEIVDTIEKTYTIVGIIERPASNIEQYDAPGYTVITYIDDNNIGNTADAYVRLNKYGSKNYLKITANILEVNENAFIKVMTGDYNDAEEDDLSKSKYIYNINSYLITLEGNPLFDNNTTGGLGIVVIIVIGIIIVTSVFCIKNSFDISITEKIKQYGMLRSVGATKKQIKKNVFFEGTMLGLIGIPCGVILGLFASYFLIVISNLLLNGAFSTGLKLYLKISYLAVIISIILGMITIYLSAFKSAKKASKVSPITSIRNSADIKIKTKNIKCPKLIKKLFGVGGEISYKNYKRNRKKYRTTIISIIVSVAIFIALSYFMEGAFRGVSNEISTYDYNISLTIYDENAKNKALSTLNLDNIDDYAVFRYDDILIQNPKRNKAYTDLENQNDITYDENESYIEIISLGDYQYRKYLDSLNLNYDEYQDKAILFAGYEKFEIFNEETKKTDKKYAIKYNYKENDEINVNFMKEEKEYDSETKSLDITNGEIVNKNIKIGYVTSEKLPYGLSSATNTTFIVVSDKLYNELIEDQEFYILYSSSNPDKLQDQIDEILNGEDYSLNNIDENAKLMNNLFTLVAIFLYGFIIVISLIGITNIFNTITTNMNLRKPEFAMLKSVGMTSKEFNRMIRLESIFIGFKSLIWGIGTGLGLSYVMYYFLEQTSGFAFKMPILAIFISIVVVYLLIIILMKYSMGKINKQNTIETIRNENI